MKSYFTPKKGKIQVNLSTPCPEKLLAKYSTTISTGDQAMNNSIDGIDYGPLGQLLGRWIGERGLDVAPDGNGDLIGKGQ